MVDELVHFIRLLPEPCCLLEGTGKILVANTALGELTGVGLSVLAGMELETLVTDPPEKVRQYLALCARSRQLVPGSLTWVIKGGEPSDIRCDGAVLSPRSDEAPAVLFLRCRPKAE